MSIRLIASDIDGTLLDAHSHMTQANIEAIRRLSDYGVEFLICSGREFQDAKEVMKNCGVTCGYICLSGAMVYESDGTIAVDIPLEPQNLADIAQVFKKFGSPMDILTSHGRYSTVFQENKPGFVHDMSEIPSYVKRYKICGNGLDRELVIRMKEAFKAFPDLAAASSFPTNIELTHVFAQKGTALKNYAKAKGIDLSDIMVLGDSDNDISMFTPEFGWTVAMGNAMQCIKDRAKYVTKSNTENGVAWAIHKYVFAE